MFAAKLMPLWPPRRGSGQCACLITPVSASSWSRVPSTESRSSRRRGVCGQVRSLFRINSGSSAAALPTTLPFSRQQPRGCPHSLLPPPLVPLPESFKMLLAHRKDRKIISFPRMRGSPNKKLSFTNPDSLSHVMHFKDHMNC